MISGRTQFITSDLLAKMEHLTMHLSGKRNFSVASTIVAGAFVLLTSLVIAQSPQPRQSLTTKAAAPSSARVLGRLPAARQLDLAISLPLRNQEQLTLFLQQLEDPASVNYHHYLTPEQFTDQYGPTVAQFQQVIAWAESHGFAVAHTSSNRALLNVTATVAQVEQTFQVKMHLYQHPTESRTFFAPDIEPTVDTGLPILSVSGLSSYSRPQPMLQRDTSGVHSNQTGSGPGGQFLGSDFRAAYYGSGPATGSGQALALIEFGQWNMADVQAYYTAVGQTNNVPIILELTGGTSGACPGACNDGEEANDVIQILSMAPGASVLIVYEDTSNNADINMFNAYATDNIAKQISMSFGIGNGNAAADEQAFQQMHAQGQNFFLASGDEGANLGDGGWPGYSQNVTDVGGTDLTTTGAGGAWSAESGWVGSGTGWCDTTLVNGPCYKVSNAGIPSYQSAIAATIATAGGSTKYRDVPDVAADANTDSFWCASGTCQGGLGGTSLAAPRWAGFLALANEQAAANGEAIGFLNPAVYALGQTSNYDTAFHDITTGSNPSGSTVPSCCIGSFTAATGFDMVTGWGTPNSQGMINALAPVSTANPFFTLSASPATLSLTPGGAPGTATISLTPGNGFSGSVTLSATIIGAPAGITATFNPTSISGSQTSTLTVSTTGSSPAGTQMIAVTGTSSTGVGTQPAFVAVALPDFSLSVTPTTSYPGQPSTIYLNQSSTATAAVDVNSQNNFNGTVALSVSSLPTGVTASFNPSSTSTTSTMTLLASSTAATVSGDYLTVSGTSGNISPLNAPYTIVSVSAATGTGGSGTPVDLSSAYNLPAIYADGITFGTGMDGDGFGYSSNLLTPNRILSGVQFNFGAASSTNCAGSGQPACTNDAVSGAGQTITLPTNQQSTYTSLQLLATAINGPILSQTITVTYTDGSTSQFSQNFSDWCSCSSSTPGPGQQPGESFAVVMPYRNEATGAQDNRPFNLYGYTFVLNSNKTVKSFTLPSKPSSGAVIVLAATLTTQSLGNQVSFASVYNTAGLYNNSVTFPATGGMDGGGNNCTLTNGCADAYSAQQLGLSSTTPATLTIKGLVFDFGPVNTTSCTTACVVDMVNLKSGVSVVLPSNQQTSYTTMTLLGTGVQGSHTGTVTVAYASGTPTVFNQTFSDWCNFQNASGNESIAVGGMSRINSDGTLNTQAACNLYAYTYLLDSTRTVQSIGLASTDGTAFSLVLAMTLSGNNSSPQLGYSLSVGTASPASVNAGASSTATVTVTPANGYTGSVTLSCSISPVVSGNTAPTCSLSPNPVSITSGAVTSTLTFNTVAPGGNVARRLASLPATYNPSRWTPWSWSVAIFVPGAGLMFLSFASVGPRRRKLLGFSLFYLLLACVILPACGGSSGSGGGGGGCAAAPGVPTGLAASSTTSSATTLNWTASTAPSGCSVTGYTVYKNGTSIATQATTTYQVTGLAASTQYSFTVAASDSAGASAQSSAINVTTLSAGTPSGTYTITITGKDAGGVTQTGNPGTVTVTVN
jgi:hypothetical protein